MKKINKSKYMNKLPRAIAWLAGEAVCMILVCMLIFGQFASGRASKTSFEDMKAAVTGAVTLTDTLEGNDQMIRRLYGLNPGDYEGIYLAYPKTNMGADELLLVKMKDSSQRRQVEDAIRQRNAIQKKNFDGYGTNQYSLLTSAVTELRGNYALYLVAEDTAPGKKAFDGKY